MRKMSIYNNPQYYSNISDELLFHDGGASIKPVYAVVPEERVVISEQSNDGNVSATNPVMLDDVDKAIIEEIARSKYISALQIYRFVKLRGLQLKRENTNKRLKKLVNHGYVKEYRIIRESITNGLKVYEVDSKGMNLAIQNGVIFHKGNRFYSDFVKKEKGIVENPTDMKRVLVGNMIVQGLLMNQAKLEWFGIQETFHNTDQDEIDAGCIIRTAASITIDNDSILLYEVVRNGPDSMDKLCEKLERYYAIVRSPSFIKDNLYGFTSLPQLVICGETYEHNLEIDRYIRNNNMWSEQDTLLYTEDLLHIQPTLVNLYELDEMGNRKWYRIPSCEEKIGG